jgi:hypothetical protein
MQTPPVRLRLASGTAHLIQYLAQLGKPVVVLSVDTTT